MSILSYDIWFYFSHVMLHHKRLYKYHKEHHSKLIPTFLDTYLGNILEGPFQGIGMLVPFILWNYTIYDILAILLLLNVRGMMRHDERFVFLVGNHHLLHHKYPNYNFGEYWIDSLFGTNYKPNS
jgi:sterol desaturase/sphingolipid hydroxylase (fatty acid hydroxylase superfamily)